MRDIIVMDHFIERDYGATSWLLKQERKERFPDGKYPGLESKESVAERTMRGLHEVVTQYPGEQIVIVSHGGAINSILSVLSNGEIGSGKTILRNGSMSFITLTGQQWTIEAYNVTAP